MLRVPNKIKGPVTNFAKKISDHAPLFVPVKPTKMAEPLECFYNVQKHIENNGGEIVFGWQIWMWPNVFIEAEHHAVWRSPSGELIDITPKEDNEKQILFLPDPTKVFDFKHNQLVDNIRESLRNDPEIKRFFNLAEQKFRLREQTSADSGLEMRFSEQDMQKLMQIEQELTIANMSLIHKYLGPNDPCPCKSGKKHKKCCGA